METLGGGEPVPQFADVVRLAASIAHPLAMFDAASCGLGLLSPAEIAGIARRQGFRRPIERAILRQRGIDRIVLGAGDVATLASAADGRLALLLLHEEHARLAAAALFLAAATLQRDVLRLTRKVDRQRIRDILGPEAHVVATQEAPTLHPGLALASAGRVLDAAMAETLDVAASRARLVDFGLRLLWRFVVLVAPSLGDVMLHRLPPAARAEDLRVLVGDVDARQARQFTRFLRRRMPEWSAIIS